jgi:hypothetical protein
VTYFSVAGRSSERRSATLRGCAFFAAVTRNGQLHERAAAGPQHSDRQGRRESSIRGACVTAAQLGRYRSSKAIPWERELAPDRGAIRASRLPPSRAPASQGQAQRRRSPSRARRLGSLGSRITRSATWPRCYPGIGATRSVARAADQLRIGSLAIIASLSCR